MARPKKIGLEYFPVDVEFDEKMQVLETKFKNDGVAWMLRFWQMAYKTETGEVNIELFGELLANNSYITLEQQQNMLILCEKLGLLFQITPSVWTSNGIKKRIAAVSHDRETAIIRQNELRESKEKRKYSIVKSKSKETPHYSPNNDWENNFDIYKINSLNALKGLLENSEWVSDRQKYHPNLNVQLSLEKAWADFWGTEAGWKHKKAKKVSEIDWKRTANNALNQKCNQVWKEKPTQGKPEYEYQRNAASKYDKM